MDESDSPGTVQQSNCAVATIGEDPDPKQVVYFPFGKEEEIEFSFLFSPFVLCL